jgi:hypothetical protein
MRCSKQTGEAHESGESKEASNTEERTTAGVSPEEGDVSPDEIEITSRSDIKLYNNQSTKRLKIYDVIT